MNLFLRVRNRGANHSIGKDALTDVQHREAGAVARANIHGEAALGLAQPPLQRPGVVGLDCCICLQIMKHEISL